MPYLSTRRAARRGITAPLVALMLIPLLGMLAFSMDMGYILIVRTELQNAADAAAQAGAQQLMQPYVNAYAPGNYALNGGASYIQGYSAAKYTAMAVGRMNTAGGKNINIQNNQPNNDVQVGYYDGTTFTQLPTSWSTNYFPNTVRVTARRDSSGDSISNGPVPLFFGPIFNMRNVPLTATAQASIYTANSVQSFQNVSNLKIPIIPATLDVMTWRNYLDNGSIDGTSTQTKASTAVDTTGNKALQVYGSIKGDGNFGSLPIDGQHEGNLVQQMQSGLTQDLLTTLLSHNSDTSTPLMPLPQWDMNTMSPLNNAVPSGYHDPNIIPANDANANTSAGSYNWQGDPGFRATDATNLNTYDGQTFLLPLYKAYQVGTTDGTTPYVAAIGNGSTYWFNIVTFVPVQITTVTGMDTNRAVYIRPSAMVLDPNQVILKGSQLAQPPSMWSTFTAIMLPPRLTQ